MTGAAVAQKPARLLLPEGQVESCSEEVTVGPREEEVEIVGDGSDAWTWHWLHEGSRQLVQGRRVGASLEVLAELSHCRGRK